jgi:hypothetical protein
LKPLDGGFEILRQVATSKMGLVAETAGNIHAGMPGPGGTNWATEFEGRVNLLHWNDLFWELM